MPKSGGKGKNRVVIPYRPLWFYLSLGAGTFFGLIAIALIVLFIQGRTQDAKGRSSIPYLGISTFGAFSFGSLAFYYGVMKPRLVLDDDFLELRVGMGRGTARGQIPIDNIASAELTKVVTIKSSGYEREKVGFVVDILPLRHRDEETWWPGYNGKKGEAIRIMDEYVRPPSLIRGRILKRVEQHRERARSKRRDA